MIQEADTHDTYQQFLKAKVKLAEQAGFECRADEINPACKPHQVDTIVWSVRGGRRANFSAFGLGKTIEQLEIARLINLKAGPGSRALIVCPLGVKQEFARDAVEVLGWPEPPLFVRTTGAMLEHEAAVAGSQEPVAGSQEKQTERQAGLPLKPATGYRLLATASIYLTNYESIREGKIDPAEFTSVLLDEAAILRGFGGSKTFRELMLLCTGDGGPSGRFRDKRVRYRFVATATPAPNEYIEILAYSEFLGIMDISQAKTRFFKRDSTHADNLTLYPGRARDFWLWVSSWALFVTKPSDLGHSDEGYSLPALDVHWHEVPTDHRDAGKTKWGQYKLFRNAAIGVQDAAAEKRISLPARIAKMMELRAIAPNEHRIIWHDLEAERHAIAAAIPDAVSVWGNQDLDERERRIIGFSNGEFAELSTKPVIAGCGCNFQRHCNRAIFLGIGFKFNDFIQAIHRIQRFMQPRPVRIDLIYTEAEGEVKRQLERKWEQHNAMVEQMTKIIKEYGLSHAAMASALSRKMGVERVEVSEPGRYRLVNNDCVPETRSMETGSVALVLTSIPFSSQYEYSPNYADFGHSDGNAEFFNQMEFLTPELLRVMAPGRVAAIHVKDRIVPGGMTGLGFQTVYPFHCRCIEHYVSHGFAYMGMVTVVTDVVRENNQTYRLGWTRQCLDATCMGVGMPEYVLLFRKPTTDPANSYADTPPVKDKAAYTRSRWQIDAHGFWRSGGDRLMTPEELRDMPHRQIFRWFKEFSLNHVYDLDHHVTTCEGIEADGRLPTTFMLLQPQSWAPDVWADVTRMLTLNGSQHAKGKQMHLCPMQFDIADRIIERFTMPGETVYDPFGGLMTVPYRAIKKGRVGVGCELNAAYFLDGCSYCRAAVADVNMPSLFAAEDTAEPGTRNPEAEDDHEDLSMSLPLPAAAAPADGQPHAECDPADDGDLGHLPAGGPAESGPGESPSGQADECDAGQVQPCEERDELFDQAVEIVRKAGRESFSLLQRRLNISFGRAARLLSAMKEAGIHADAQNAEVVA